MNPVLEAESVKGSWQTWLYFDREISDLSHSFWQALVTAVLLERPDDPSFFMLRHFDFWSL